MAETILLYQIFSVIFLIFLSAFFSSSETAITSISEDVLQKKVEENDYRSIRTQKLLKKKNLLLVVFYLEIIWLIYLLQH